MVEAPQLASGERAFPAPAAEGIIFEEKAPRERTFKVIQGGMGAGVSGWELARAVAMAGEKLNEPVLGVVSGTGLPTIMVGRLRNGDLNTIEALEEFDKRTGKKIGEGIINEYKPNRLKSPPKPEVLMSSTTKEEIREKMTYLAVASAFVEVWLAKQGHSGPIGINLLEKIQLLHLPTLLGAMLAGVDYVLVGAGVPDQIPQVLKNFAKGLPASYRLELENEPKDLSKELKEKVDKEATMTLDPTLFTSGRKELKIPQFYAIISSNPLAQWLSRIDGVNGYIIEGPLAGGHNAPPRVKNIFNEYGEPVYGEKDKVDLKKLKELGKPFYLAGAQATRKRFEEAIVNGAAGIQVGSLFALCEESGLRPDLKQQLIEEIIAEKLEVFADPNFSPSNYPFNVVKLPGTLSDPAVYVPRTRVCNAGYLVHVYLQPDGKIDFRCPAEPGNEYVRKGGKLKDTVGKGCLCNGLLATAGFAQSAAGLPRGRKESPVVTFGKDWKSIRDFVISKGSHFTAEDVVRYLTS